ncbi:hypothetical protein LOTGIDRAFT_169257 [Lottia gigantea]|uniref:Ionotropic glutamate receptor C-terminal domain-containing protein n=1 Tax=Lottia gigantea TaxID=225164 RepID=V3YZF1_LOTGI|nr:hypothetical protein LOTGIDRAFT_169257 [Lottia gigantea]ESO83563.1 hypothetical protein LOTGIDRAFT_169257 [Lottia gigantea]
MKVVKRGVLLLTLTMILGTTSRKNAVKTLITMIDMLKWRKLNLFYDDKIHNKFIDEILKYLDDTEAQRNLINLGEISASRLEQTLMKIHASDFPDIHFVYLAGVNHSKSLEFIRSVNNYDLNSNKTTDFRSKSQWILIVSSSFVSELKQVLLDLCHVVLVVPLQGGCVEVKTLVKTPTGPNFVNVRPDKLRIKDDLFPNIKYGYNGRNLILGMVPYFYIRSHIMNNGSIKYVGWMMDLLVQLAHTLNFTYIEYESDDYKYLIQKTIRREIDVLYGEYILTQERSRLMHFINPPMKYDAVVVLYRKIKEDKKTGWIGILRPFEYNVYYIIIIAYIIITCVYTLVEYIAMRSFRKSTKVSKNLKEIPFGLFGSLFQEGGHLQPKTDTGRILLASWWLFCVVIASSYSAYLISSLVFEPEIEPFSSLQQLVELPDWKIGIPGDTGVIDMFKNSSDETIKLLWHKIQKSNTTQLFSLDTNITRQYERVKKTEKYAFVFADGLRSIDNKDDCFSTMRIGLSVQVSFYVPLQSPLIRDMEQTVSRFSDNGLLNMLFKADLRKHSCEWNNQLISKQKDQTIGIGNLLGVFYIVPIGVVFAILGLFAEYLYVKIYELRTNTFNK